MPGLMSQHAGAMSSPHSLPVPRGRPRRRRQAPADDAGRPVVRRPADRRARGARRGRAPVPGPVGRQLGGARQPLPVARRLGAPLDLPAQRHQRPPARLVAVDAQRRRWPATSSTSTSTSASPTCLGTRLALGSAVIEVTEPPHPGCAKFVERFGQDAAARNSRRARAAPAWPNAKGGGGRHRPRRHLTKLGRSRCGGAAVSAHGGHDRGVREVALDLLPGPEASTTGKFRVGRIVYLAFLRDEQHMGFAFPKEEREALVAAETPTSSRCPAGPTCVTTGSSSAWTPSTTPRCASSCSTPGAWSSPGASPPNTSASEAGMCPLRQAPRAGSGGKTLVSRCSKPCPGLGGWRPPRDGRKVRSTVRHPSSVTRATMAWVRAVPTPCPRPAS